MPNTKVQDLAEKVAEAIDALVRAPLGSYADKRDAVKAEFVALDADTALEEFLDWFHD